MKAKFFFLGLCALALAACSIDEVSQVNDTNAIQFKTTVATRAAAVTTNTINDFSVWAWNGDNEFMDDVIATRSGNSSTFTTSPLYFWPTGSVDFYAITPSTKLVGNENGKEYAYFGGELNDSDGTWSYTGYVGQASIAKDEISVAVTVPHDAADQIDLCYAVAKEQSSGGVPMNFRHIFSQLAFKALNTNEEMTIKIDGVSVCSVFMQGTYSLPTVSTSGNLDSPNLGTSGITESQGEWSETLTHKARFNAGISNTTLEGVSEEAKDITSDPLMVLPQQVKEWDVYTDPTDTELGSYIRIACNISENGSQLWPNSVEEGNSDNLYTGSDGVEYAEIAIPVEADWAEGYRYTYTLIFGEGAGYYPPDDPNADYDGTPILYPITFTVTVDEFQDAVAEDDEYDVTTKTGVVKTAKDLQAAVAAQYSPIEIAADITLDGYLLIDYDCELTIDAGCTLTGPNGNTEGNAIDHNGDEGAGGYSAIIYVNGGNLTIYGDGTVTTDGSADACLTNAIWVVDGTVTVYGGTFMGSNWDYTPETTSWSKHAVYCGEGGYAYLYGGTYSCGYTNVTYATNENGYWVLNCHNESEENGHAMIYCYGGTYVNFDPANPSTDDAKSYCAEGYGTVYDETTNSYTVILTTVATPADLAAALAAGASEITVSESFSIEQGSGSGYFWSYNDCTITLEDGVTISLDEMSSIANYAFFIAKSGTLTIEGNGTLKSNGSTQDMGCMCFWLDGGDVVINGGNFYSAAWAEESSSDTAACVYVNLGTATINGGSFYGSHNVTAYTGSSYLLNCTDANYKADPRKADIICYGGAFCDFDPADNYAEGANTNFCAEGYKSVQSDAVDADGWYWYTVTKE